MTALTDALNRWWHLFESNQLDQLHTVVRDDAVIRMPGGLEFVGPSQLRPMLESYRSAFPDIRHETVASVESGRRIAAEIVVRGTHTGTFATPAGELPPTGNPIVIQSCDVVTFDDDGKVASWHTYFDMASFMAQLGVAQPAGA